MPANRLRTDLPFQPAIDAAAQQVTWLIEQLGYEFGSPVSRSAIRDVVEATAPQSFDQLEQSWHTWLAESLESAGRRCQPIDCTVDQAVQMARNGAQVIGWVDGNKWLAIAKFRRRRLLVLRPGHDTPKCWLTPAQLSAVLDANTTGGMFRCVAIEPRFAAPTTGDHALKPLQRFWTLLQPEWPDIWIVIVFAMVIGVLALATPIAVETLVNTVAFGKLLQPVVVLSLLLLTFLAFSAALRALQTYVVEIIQRRLFARVAADLAFRLPRVESESLEGRSARELVNRFFDVVVVQKITAQLLLDGISLVLVTLIGMALLAFYHPWLLGFDVMLLTMIALIVFVLGRGAVKTSIKESKIKYRMAAWLQEVASCRNAFRHGGAARFALERADRLTFDYLTARSGHFRILMRQVIFALAMQAVASTVLLGLGGWLVISGQLTLGQLVAAELIVAVIVGSFAKLGKHMESFYDVLASVDKLGALFDLPIERQEGLLSSPAEATDAIELIEVGYRYPNGRRALASLNQQIETGDRIALTGPGGSGKSTLLDLLFGLRTPTEGRITIFGADVRELRPDALRSRIALVREIETIDGTIAENVRLGRSHVSFGDVRAALQNVGLLDDVLSLPGQLDTPLAAAGQPLSATQLMRLMLARACAGAPELLLIDGALDVFPDNEATALAQWLCDTKRPWTLILATGRQSLVATCNRRIELIRAAASARRAQSNGEATHA